MQISSTDSWGCVWYMKWNFKRKIVSRLFVTVWIKYTTLNIINCLPRFIIDGCFEHSLLCEPIRIMLLLLEFLMMRKLKGYWKWENIKYDSLLIWRNSLISLGRIWNLNLIKSKFQCSGRLPKFSEEGFPYKKIT